MKTAWVRGLNDGLKPRPVKGMGVGFGDAGRGSAGVIERERFTMYSKERRCGTPYGGTPHSGTPYGGTPYSGTPYSGLTKEVGRG